MSEDDLVQYKGKKYVRVSRVIQKKGAFDHIDPAVLANKCRIGTNVHDHIAKDIDGEFVIPQGDEKGYFNSYLKWKDELNPVFYVSEKRYFCDEKLLTGQIDCIAIVPSISESPLLIDFKTSAQESKETWEMQAHLYNHLLLSNGIIVNPRYLFVKLNKMGELPQVFSYNWSANINAKCMRAIDNFWNIAKK